MGLNLYGYVNNDPVNFVDPLGLWQITFGGGDILGGAITFGNNGGNGVFASLVGRLIGSIAGDKGASIGARIGGFLGANFGGQWNVGAYAGVGEGGFLSIDPNDHGCEEESKEPLGNFHGSLRGEGALGAGSSLDGEFNILGISDNSENEWGVSANVGLPGIKDLDFGGGLEGKGNNAPTITGPTFGFGEGMYIGVGYSCHN